MEATLDLPPIDSSSLPPPAAARTELASAAAQQFVDLATVDLTDLALARFGDWRGQVAAARSKLDGLVLDLSTPTKLADAKTLRQQLINAPRAAARATSKELRSKLSQVGKAVAAAEDQIVGEFDKAETLITPQIDAAQQRLDDERAERERQAAEAARAEAQRKAAHESGIATISGYVDLAKGKTAAEIQKVLDHVLAIQMAPEDWAAFWEEFADRAAAARAETIRALEALHVAAEKAEADAAELERRRAEHRRMVDATASLERLQQQVLRAGSGIDAAGIREVLAETEAWPVDESLFGALTAAAEISKRGAVTSIRAMLASAEQKEAMAAQERAAAPPAAEAGMGQDSTQLAEPTGDGKGVTPAAGDREAPPITPNAQEEEKGLLPPGPAAQCAGNEVDPAKTSPSGEEEEATEAGDGAASAHVCRGRNCGAIDGMDHSADCLADHAAITSAAAAADDAGSLETSEADAVVPTREAIAAATQRRVILLSDEPEDILGEVIALVEHAAQPFDGRWPTHPKPDQPWWSELRQRIDALRPKLKARAAADGMA